MRKTFFSFLTQVLDEVQTNMTFVCINFFRKEIEDVDQSEEELEESSDLKDEISDETKPEDTISG